MARPRTPTAVLALRGAFKNHPSRFKERESEPRVTTMLPDPPNYLATVSASMWLEMKARGWWLTSADKFLVEIAATLMARYRRGRLRSGDVSLLIGLLGKIGFSPSERGRMNLGPVITKVEDRNFVTAMDLSGWPHGFTVASPNYHG